MPLRDPDEFGKEYEFDIPTPEGVVPSNIRMINSSNVKWIGWPRTVSQTPLMFVEFMDGSRYVYLGVTRQRAVAAAYAESSGSYLARYIRPFYQYARLR